MRKTDKAAKQNKPPKAKVEGGGIGTLKPTKEEIAENRKRLFIILLKKKNNGLKINLKQQLI